MSFLFGGRPQQTSGEKIAAAEDEIEMISDMFNRLAKSCTTKCVSAEYRESDLNKGESVCLDRCVAKFFDVNMKVSEAVAQNRSLAGPAAGGIAPV